MKSGIPGRWFLPVFEFGATAERAEQEKATAFRYKFFGNG